MKARNKRRSHILPARWRKLEVRGRRKIPDTDSRQMHLKLQIEELEGYIVGAGTAAQPQKTGGILPTDAPASGEAPSLPMRSDQRMAAGRERTQLLISVALLILIVAALVAWFSYRLISEF